MKRKFTSKKLFVLSNEGKLKQLVADYHQHRPNLHYPKYLYVLHLLIHKMTYQADRYCQKGKSLHINKLESVIGDHASEVVNNLKKWGYIYRQGFYTPGVTATTYKLHSQYEQSSIKMKFFKPSTAKFIRNLIDAERKKTLTPVETNVKHVLENLITISEKGLQHIQQQYPSDAMSEAINLYRSGFVTPGHDAMQEAFETLEFGKESQADLALLSFLDRDFYTHSGGKGGRLHHNMCNLKREYRDFLLLRGEPMVHTDIVNSQVVISIPVIREAMGDIISDDFQRYIDCAVSGRFYEVLAEQMEIEICEKKSRDDFKKLFFGTVFFGKPMRGKGTPLMQAFRQLYPNVERAIRKIKNGDHARFSIRLQELESNIIICEVLPHLQEEGYLVLPLHDAIYANCKAAIERAKEMIAQSFQSHYGLQIRFKDGISNADAQTHHRQAA
jgi:hypothetical protein